MNLFSLYTKIGGAGGMYRLARKTTQSFRDIGFGRTCRKIRHFLLPGRGANSPDLLPPYDLQASYKEWIKTNETGDHETAPLPFTPLISIITPVYGVPAAMFKECVESVLSQTYANWQLCLVNDCWEDRDVALLLEEYSGHEKITVRQREERGGISAASNDGITMARGEFIAFLDCDDIIPPNALYEFAKLLNEHPEYDLIYTDEDKISEDGRERHTPFFKPDWSPDTLFSVMYTCHFSLYRKSLVDQIGGYRSEVDGAQDHDFALRFTERTDKIGHIPKILYHWRQRQGSTSLDATGKPYVVEASRKTKQCALERRGWHGSVEFIPEISQYRIKYLPGPSDTVSILIPSKDNLRVAKECIDSILARKSSLPFEIILFDNGSSNKNKAKYAQYCAEHGVAYRHEPMEFNFAAICNIMAAMASGNLLLFLNDDITVITDDWLERLAGHALLPHAGAVGAKLYYPDGDTIQHIGVVNLPTGPDHCMARHSDVFPFFNCFNRMEWNYIAVTGACLMIERSKFKEAGMFDEALSVSYNDVDLCFTLLERGYFNVVRNDVQLFHYESMSRGYDLKSAKKLNRLNLERKYLFSKHPQFYCRDPFYSQNFTPRNSLYHINTDNSWESVAAAVREADAKIL